MLSKKEKSRYTRAKNALEKWNRKYLSGSSPYVVNQFRRAQTKYNEVVNQLRDKYKGMQVSIDL